jgi:hypothetical protein
MGAAITVYVRKQDALVELSAREKSESEKLRVKAKANWSSESMERIIFDHHCVRQPVSDELVRRAAALGIAIEPFYDSDRIASIVIRTRISDPEFMRLLEEGSASDTEIAGVRSEWWEKNRARYEKAEETLTTHPKMIEARRQFENRLAEIDKMKGLIWEERFQLRYEAIDELSRIRQNVILQNGISPAENANSQRK